MLGTPAAKKPQFSLPGADLEISLRLQTHAADQVRAHVRPAGDSGSVTADGPSSSHTYSFSKVNAAADWPIFSYLWHFEPAEGGEFGGVALPTRRVRLCGTAREEGRPS